MSGWERLQRVEDAWPGVFAALGLLAALLALRWFVLPADRRKNTTSPALFLLGALALHPLATAIGADGMLRSTLGVFTLVFFALGGTGLLNVFAFDLVFRRARVPSVVRDVVQALALFVLLLVMLRRSGVDLFSLVTTSAVVTAIIGLALQNTIANLFAGVTLPLEHTLAIGDWIRVNGHIGRIVEISWRATSLVTKDGDVVCVPNSQLLAAEVHNYSRPTAYHRVWLRVGFHYRHPPNEVRRVLLEAVRGAPGVLAMPDADCFPVEFSESAVTYALRYWIEDFEREEPISGEVRARIWYAAQRAGLEIPFPIRTIVNASPSAERLDAERAEESVERLAALGHVFLLAPLDDADRELLAAGMRRERFGASEPIIHQGDPGYSLYLVQSGEIGVFLTLDGAQRQVARLGPGDFFGEMSLMTGEPRQASCTALTDAVCWVVDHAVFRRVLDAKPKLAEELSAVLAARQAMLDGERDGLSAAARARRAAEAQSHLLARIQGFFHLGGERGTPPARH
jgi:small-conductance mechanosensitive channel/CRP-like cAMP-binding protein